jgi:hypothetical protein
MPWLLRFEPAYAGGCSAIGFTCPLQEAYVPPTDVRTPVFMVLAQNVGYSRTSQDSYCAFIVPYTAFHCKNHLSEYFAKF